MAYGDHPGQDPLPTYSPIQHQADYEKSVTVPCKYCGAAIGQGCRNKDTGQLLQFAPAHTPRLIEAVKAEEKELPF